MEINCNMLLSLRLHHVHDALLFYVSQRKENVFVKILYFMVFLGKEFMSSLPQVVLTRNLLCIAVKILTVAVIIEGFFWAGNPLSG
jgi:hypothetical protein